MSESEVTETGLPCESCGSSDAKALYDDGHTYCFSCEKHTQGDGEAKPAARFSPAGLIPMGEYEYLKARKINLDTCKKFRYSVGHYKGEKVHIAAFCDAGGRVVCQKLRTASKDFVFLGPKEVKKNPPLFGQHLCRDHGKMIVITEGELDAMAAAQAMSPKLTWPAVSVPNGAQAAKKHIAHHIEWLCNYERVVLAFDMDEPGRKAAEECAALFPPGKVFIANLPEKDACEAIKQGKYKELVESFWGAKSWRPDGIVTVGEILDEVLNAPTLGAPWPWQSLTDLTMGRRLGEYTTIGAGTGIGKTDFMTQTVAHDIMNLNIKCGLIFLEQAPRDTVRRLAGKVDGKQYHLPQEKAGWSTEELEKTVGAIEATNNLVLYNHYGSMDWVTIKAKIRYMVLSLDCKHIYLDHLTALAAAADDEKTALEHLTAEIASLVQELQIHLHLVSHLSTPLGTSHEEGGRVVIKNFKGSRAIGFWSHNMIGLERDQQTDDENERLTTTVRILKCRENGSDVGKTFGIKYDPKTGMLNETDTHTGDVFDAEETF